MGVLALLACAVLAAPQEPAAETGDASASVPAAIPSAPPALPLPAAEASPAVPVVAIPAQDPPRAVRFLEDRPESGPSVAGFVAGSVVVVALLGGALFLLRRYGRSARFLGTGGPVRVLARAPLGPRQDVFLVEIGPRVFVIGSDRKST